MPRHCRLVHRQALLGYVLQSGSYFHVLSTQTACRWSLSQPTYIIFLVLYLLFFHRQMSRSQCQRLDGADLYNPEYPDKLEFVHKLLTTGNLMKNLI